MRVATPLPLLVITLSTGFAFAFARPTGPRPADKDPEPGHAKAPPRSRDVSLGETVGFYLNEVKRFVDGYDIPKRDNEVDLATVLPRDPVQGSKDGPHEKQQPPKGNSVKREVFESLNGEEMAERDNLRHVGQGSRPNDWIRRNGPSTLRGHDDSPKGTRLPATQSGPKIAGPRHKPGHPKREVFGSSNDEDLSQREVSDTEHLDARARDPSQLQTGPRPTQNPQHHQSRPTWSRSSDIRSGKHSLVQPKVKASRPRTDLPKREVPELSVEEKMFRRDDPDAELLDARMLDPRGGHLPRPRPRPYGGGNDNFKRDDPGSSNEEALAQRDNSDGNNLIARKDDPSGEKTPPHYGHPKREVLESSRRDQLEDEPLERRKKPDLHAQRKPPRTIVHPKANVSPSQPGQPKREVTEVNAEDDALDARSTYIPPFTPVRGSGPGSSEGGKPIHPREETTERDNAEDELLDARAGITGGHHLPRGGLARAQKVLRGPAQGRGATVIHRREETTERDNAEDEPLDARAGMTRGPGHPRRREELSQRGNLEDESVSARDGSGPRLGFLGGFAGAMGRAGNRNTPRREVTQDAVDDEFVSARDVNGRGFGGLGGLAGTMGRAGDVKTHKRDASWGVPGVGYSRRDFEAAQADGEGSEE